MRCIASEGAMPERDQDVTQVRLGHVTSIHVHIHSKTTFSISFFSSFRLLYIYIIDWFSTTRIVREPSMFNEIIT